jgi:GH18 family chitinase
MTAKPPSTPSRVVGYFPSDALHARNYPVSGIPADMLTHLVYAFATVSAAGECASVKAQDDKINFPQLIELKQQHTRLQTLISIGGASGSGHFAHAASTKASRQKLAKSCIRFMKKNGFDGIDLDWEFPAERDKPHLTALLAELRHELDARGKADDRAYLLTIAAPAGPAHYADLELGKIQEYVDWINLMAYDFYTPASKTTDFGAPLYPPSDDPAPAAIRLTYNVDAAVKAYLEARVPADKLVVGVPFIGTGWQGVPPAQDGLYQPNTGPGKGTWEPGRYDYKDISANYLPTYTRHWHEDAQVPWLYDPATGILITYEDPQSLTAKVNYVTRNQLGGIMIWQLAADDTPHTLLSTISGLVLPGPTAVNLGGVDLTTTVLQNLQPGSPAQEFIGDALNTDLKDALVGAATRAGEAALAGLLKAMPAVDIASVQGMTLQALVTQEIALPSDPTAKAAIQAAIAKLSTTTTVGDLLGLNSTLQESPLFSAEVKKAGMANLLATSPALGSSPQVVNSFISRYAASKGPIGDFWQVLSNDATFKAAVPELQLSLQLGSLTLDNPPMVAALRANAAKLASPRDLAGLTAANLQDLITKNQVPVPASVAGATPQEKVANYAQAMAQSLARAFPGVGFRLSLLELLGRSGDTPDVVNQGAATFLSNAADFDLLSTNLRTYTAANAQTAFNGVDSSLHGRVTSLLMTWQRIARIAPDFTTSSAIVAAGYTSAYHLAVSPRAGVRSRLAPALGSTAAADAVHARARQIAGTAMGLLANVRHALAVPATWVLGDVRGALLQFLDGPTSPSPSWQTLFGSQSYCACSDCRSVFSAAAYFVDLLQFLGNSGTNASGQTPLDVLLARRPDLAFLKLNCENINTTLPYVDLVNEILEGFVAWNGTLAISSGGTEQTVAHDTPADATADELSASPEYTNDVAYNQYLNAAIYPPTLPYDRWLDTARTYLNFLGGSLSQIMAACQQGAVADDFTKGSPSGIALACEALGISQAECEILTGRDFAGNPQSNPPALCQFYGYDPATASATWAQSVSSVPTLLQRMAIGYDDLVSLFETRALNPNETVLIQSPAGSCDITQMNLVDIAPAAPQKSNVPPNNPRTPRPLVPTPAATPASPGPLKEDPTLSLLHRFIRLWKKLGWAIEDLDKTMTALGTRDIDELLLVSIAAIKALQSSLNLPLTTVLSFWADLDTDGQGSLYLALFQNKAVFYPPSPVFRLNYVAHLSTSIPPSLQFPSTTFPNVLYDPTTQLLSTNTGIDAAEYAALLALSPDPAYQKALWEIHTPNQLTHPVVLPPGVLPTWLNYQASPPQIGFAGAMSDALRQQLNFTSDAPYQVGFDSLYKMRTLWGAELVGSPGAFLSELVSRPHPPPVPPGAKSIFVRSVAVIPAVPFVASIGSEQVLIVGAVAGESARFGATWNVVRGYNGTTALTHHIGDAVFLNALTNYANPIIAALQISVQDLNRIRSYTGLVDVVGTTLTGGIDASTPTLSVASSAGFPAPPFVAGVGSELLNVTAVSGTTWSVTRGYNGTTASTHNAGDAVVYGNLTPLDLANLSTICRYAFLAQGLNLSVSDLITAIQLIGLDPFRQQAPAGTLAIIEAIQAIQASPFSIAQLDYIYRHTYDPNAGIAPVPGNVNLLLSTLQTGIAAIANADVVVPDPKGDILVVQMAKLLGTSLATTALGLIKGTGLFSTPLANMPPEVSAFLAIPISYDAQAKALVLTGALPAAQLAQLQALSTNASYLAAIAALAAANAAAGGATATAALAALPTGVVLPDTLGSVLSYDASSQQLRVKGPMTSAEQTSLLEISTDPAYQAAVKALYQQPISFINANFSSFLDPAVAVTTLVEDPAGLTTAEKVAYVAQGLMPYLQQVQSKSLIVQTLCDNLGLDPQLGASLLSKILLSKVAPGKATARAMDDFLALLGDGLSANYYSTGNWAGSAVLSRIDPAIDFHWGFGLPDPAIATRPFSVRWTGFVMPQYTESYLFFVEAGDGYRLSINGAVVIPLPASNGPPSEVASAPVPLTAGQLYPITLEYSDITVAAQISLRWSSPSTPKAIVPQSQLFSGAIISSLAPIVDSYTLLYKVAILVNTFPLAGADVDYLSQHGGDFAGVDPSDPTNAAKAVPFDLNRLPLDPSGFTPALFDVWERANAVVSFRQGLPGGDAGLLNVFATAATSTTATPGQISSALSAAIVLATGWNAQDLAALVSAGGFDLSDADFKNEAGTSGIGLVQLHTCMALATRLGISAKQLLSWASFGPPPAAEELVAQDIQNTAKSKYDESTWTTVGKPLNDAIREDSKEALIAYILAPPTSSTWKPVTMPDGSTATTSDQLYEFFLIDVDMSTCMLTSRIVQASAAVQLFVQRCLMNLEQPAVLASSIDATQWEWMQNFRVWQAARQVLLYPEDWMVPALRDDKTPFYQALENALLQNPITPDTVEAAYLEYLYSLRDVALLDVRGTFWQLDAGSTPGPDQTPDATNDVLHVFARSLTQPFSYYYRRLLNCSMYGYPGGNSIWTPWEDVGLDIQADQLVPVVWDRRLYLFWPSFAQFADPSTQQSSINVPVPSESGQQPNTYTPSQPIVDLSVTLNWSEYLQGAWSSKQSSPPFIKTNWSLPTINGGVLDASEFFFQSAISGDSLYVYCYDFVGQQGSDVVSWIPGWFTFPGCGGMPTATAVEAEYWSQDIVPGDTSFSSNSVVDDGYSNGLCLTVGWAYGGQNSGYETSVQVLNNTPAPFNLMFPQQFYGSFAIWVPSPYTDQPFFYQDGLRSYFVTQMFPDPNANLYDATLEVPSARRAALRGSARAMHGVAIFAETSDVTLPAIPNRPEPVSPATLLSTTAAQAIARIPNRVVLDDVPVPGPTDPPSQVVFSIFFHPHVCSFIKVVRQYGLANLLTLENQAVTNDNGVIEGMELYPAIYIFEGTVRPGVNPGILTAQEQLYEFDGDTWGVVPPAPNGQSYLFYNASQGPGQPGQGFYYNSTQSATWNGDAYVGSMYLAAYAPEVSAITGPTVFEWAYQPDTTYVLPETFPRENVDFRLAGAYSIYNWELFFHIPLFVATQLSQNQQFQEAQKWFHTIFNPTISADGPVPQRYWRFLPFYEESPGDLIQGQIQNIFYPPGSGGSPSPLSQDAADQIAAWRQEPFDPFLVARMRPIAFRMKVVMAYLDNLIAWGDSLFAQNTRESIYEATQIYVLAKDILGPRPVQVPPPGNVPDYTYNDLQSLYGIDAFSNALVLMENDFPYLTAGGGSGGAGMGAALGMSNVAPYFCFPPNAMLLGYWDTVDDRLYKIRHCMNIQGVVEQLPLFAPPISPALLVAAAAAGVDLSSVLSNTAAGTPCYRFSVVLQRALDLCAEVRSLGAALLSALEKKDAEALVLVRATQEAAVLQSTLQMKQDAYQEAQTNAAALTASLQTATDRQNYYSGLHQTGLLASETQQSNALSSAASDQQDALSSLQNVPTDILIPELSFGVSGFGGSPSATVSLGGTQLAALDNNSASQSQAQAGYQSNQAAMAGLQAGWARRDAEWVFQAAQAGDEIVQIKAQIKAATFRASMAQDEINTLNLQIQNAQAVHDFLTGKYTNTQLYSWMIDQCSTVFFQCYQMAYDLAARAEAAFRFERGLTTSSYIQFGYWDSLKKGLMSGERLYTDLKRMEIAYLETDVRKFEISKSVSLVLFDPWALIALKQTGQCQINLPEAFFDMDYPGHYLRQLKTVSLTVPCVTGPYTSINCTLTLLNSKIRVDSTAASKQDYANDAHFITNYASTQSIATSTAQNDSGLFDVRFHDDEARYLPFEGAGLISTWQIDMPTDCNAFDFDTITDLVIHLKYTARNGGDKLRDIARQCAVLPPRPVQSFTGSTTPFPTQTNAQRVFSLRHEFPSEWYKFLNPADTATVQGMSIALGMDRFPYQYRNRTIKVSQVELVLAFRDLQVQSSYQQGNPLSLQLAPPGAATPSPVTVNSNASMLGGAAYGLVTNLSVTVPTGIGKPPGWTLQAQAADVARIAPALQNVATVAGVNYPHLNPQSIDDVFLLCRFTVS